jgi:imidazole glycerol-phosphate synthase subunit HisH
MKVAIFDYGTGNLETLAAAFETAGAQVTVETEPGAALHAQALVLPAGGAYAAAAGKLVPVAPSLRAALASGHPCLGIGLGMHLLFEKSDDGEGLAVLRGAVRKLNACRLPHVGWNEVTHSDDALFNGMSPFLGWYTNSLVAEPADTAAIIGWTKHESDSFPAAVRRDRTWGLQFQPEKSGSTGLRVIANFLKAASE